MNKKEVTPPAYSHCKYAPKFLIERECTVIKLEVPKDMPLEEVIQRAIAKIMGVDE